MAQAREPSLAAPQQAVVNPQAHRPRRKLQKSVTKQRSSGARRLGPGASNEAVHDNKSDTANRPLAQAQSRLPHIPLPSPDLISDSKWPEFFRGGGCLHNQDSASRSQASLVASPVAIIPELSHLAVVRNARPPRPSPSSNSHPPSSHAATMRRRAKTPIFSIGQLETIPRPCNALGKTSSVELIAEQYRALLDSRASVYSDSHSEPPPSRHGDGGDDALVTGGAALRRQQSSDELHVQDPIHHHFSAAGEQRQQPGSGGSPTTTSDDGTLVSFEEETVYFKPVSFSPEPRSPQPHFFDGRPLVFPPSPAPDNIINNNNQHSSLSLQICLDLLTRDLSSALASRPGRASPETSALQVWVMIEAYERLRDQLADVQGAGRDDWRGPLETMFDMWLRALYSIHDSLTGGDGRGSESDYYEAEMGTEELD